MVDKLQTSHAWWHDEVIIYEAKRALFHCAELEEKGHLADFLSRQPSFVFRDSESARISDVEFREIGLGRLKGLVTWMEEIPTDHEVIEFLAGLNLSQMALDDFRSSLFSLIVNFAFAFSTAENCDDPDDPNILLRQAVKLGRLAHALSLGTRSTLQ